MDTSLNNVLTTIFSDGAPANWEYNDYVNKCINKIGGNKVDALLKEPHKLREERISIQEQTQELTISNYKTFIQTAECSRELFKEFNLIENSLDTLIDHIPEFEGKCQSFIDETNDISNLRKLNSLTLTRNTQLLEILEMPQLMDSFIKDNLYEDALELAAYVRRVHSKHSDIPILKTIIDDVEKSWLLMLQQLLVQLKTDLSLPKCLQIVGHLRRMDIFTEAELRLKFLQARDAWLQSCLKAIPRNDGNHLHRTIEVTRVNLYNIITQYRAIFNDDERSPLMSIKSVDVNQNVIFFNWLNEKISEFLKTLESDLAAGVSSLETILGQCMYFGLSFSRVGADFRPSMVPIFTQAILQKFKNSVRKSTRTFHKNMENFTLINKTHRNISWKQKEPTDPLQPPETLLEFYPLAEYLNQILVTFNEMKPCMPIAIVNELIRAIEESLLQICHALLNLYSQEHQAFTANSRDAFTRLCMCFCDDMIPYLQKCVHVLFPPNNVALHLGVDVQTLQNEQITFLDKARIVGPIKHLLPARVEPLFSLHVNNNDESASEIDDGGDGDIVKHDDESSGGGMNLAVLETAAN